MISTIILYKDEEKSLQSCLGHLAWCSDIVIVIDSHDHAPIPSIHHPNVSISKRLLEDDFAKQRNYAMKQAKNHWVLFVDADEELSPELETKLKEFVPDEDFAAYRLPRIDIFWDQKMLCGEVGEAARNGILRLVNRDRGMWTGIVHEKFETKGDTGRLNEVFYHYPHQTIAEFLHDVNYYSSLRAQEIEGRPKWRLIAELLLYPPAKFCNTYLFRLGFMDGVAGFVYSFMMAFHSFLVRAKAITKTY